MCKIKKFIIKHLAKRKEKNVDYIGSFLLDFCVSNRELLKGLVQKLYTKNVHSSCHDVWYDKPRNISEE